MILVSRVLNLLALGFTVVFSGFLLLCVNWRALHAECIVADTCDISEVRACRQTWGRSVGRWSPAEQHASTAAQRL